jgi:hypothetical protein
MLNLRITSTKQSNTTLDVHIILVIKSKCCNYILNQGINKIIKQLIISIKLLMGLGEIGIDT